MRRALETEGGHPDWRGHSYTATLLGALRHWGIQGALERACGMNQAVPDCLVEGYESLESGLQLPDPDDRHVLAAAIRSGA